MANSYTKILSFYQGTDDIKKRKTCTTNARIMSYSEMQALSNTEKELGCTHDIKDIQLAEFERKRLSELENIRFIVFAH